MYQEELKGFRAPGPKTKYFARYFCRSINYNNNNRSSGDLDTLKSAVTTFKLNICFYFLF